MDTDLSWQHDIGSANIYGWKVDGNSFLILQISAEYGECTELFNDLIDPDGE